ncbi:MAG TPA: hypothetical protein VLA66_14330 [Thermoanaerobaculia bacterium]|nr:hypothetical protein [Thermoanaerobaculia bacterium]
MTAKLAPRLLVSWTTPEGAVVAREVTITPEPPPGFEDLVCIEILDTEARAFLAARSYEGCDRPFADGRESS